MLKKLTVLVFALGVAVCGLSFSGSTPHTEGKAEEAPAAAPADQLPEHAPYLFLFRHLSHLKKQSEKLRRQGKDGSGFQRRFKEALVLDDGQFEQLGAIALSCEAQLDALDKQAARVVEEFKKHYPDGPVPEGVIIPPPPAELLALQEERNRLVLNARDRVRGALGEQEFAHLDQMVRLRLVPNISHGRPSQTAP